jgi:hypothetical protein
LEIGNWKLDIGNWSLDPLISLPDWHYGFNGYKLFALPECRRQTGGQAG